MKLLHFIELGGLEVFDEVGDAGFAAWVSDRIDGLGKCNGGLGVGILEALLGLADELGFQLGKFSGRKCGRAELFGGISADPCLSETFSSRGTHSTWWLSMQWSRQASHLGFVVIPVTARAACGSSQSR